MGFSSDAIYEYLEAVKDPEVPVLSVVDMGIIREARMEGDALVVDITPTYSGCPAMGVIEDDVIAELRKHGFAKVRVNTVLSPPWTTDWMSEKGKENLRKYGIAPPGRVSESQLVPLGSAAQVEILCPRCGSEDTKITSEFGATACKALCVCNTCREPFEYFKSI